MASARITPPVSGDTAIRIVAQQGGGVNMTDLELYQKLLDASEALLRNDMLLEGVSHVDEVANQAYVMVKDGSLKLSNENPSYKAVVITAKKVLTGGTATYRNDRNKSNFRKLKYGKFIQYQGLEDQIAGFNYSEPDSDLDEVLPLIFGMMSEPGREIVEGIQPFEGNTAAYAEDLGLNHVTVWRHVEKARKEFLSLIPEDCVLYNTSRRLRQRYNIGASDVN